MVSRSWNHFESIDSFFCGNIEKYIPIIGIKFTLAWHRSELLGKVVESVSDLFAM